MYKNLFSCKKVKNVSTTSLNMNINTIYKNNSSNYCTWNSVWSDMRSNEL